MKAERPNTSTTYQEHYQDWKVVRNVRPKTVSAKNQIKNRETIDAHCKNTETWKVGGCVHLNFYMPCQVAFYEIPWDRKNGLVEHRSVKEERNTKYNKPIKKIASKRDIKFRPSEDFMNSRRINQPGTSFKKLHRVNRKEKLYDPPWGYKGHRPQTLSNSCLTFRTADAMSLIQMCP